MDAQRSALYQSLAEALAEPPGWLALPGRNWPLFEAALAFARESPAARLAVEAMLAIDEEPLQTRQRRYAGLFSGSGRYSIAMYESGALHGQLLTEETFAVEYWYRQAGLNIVGAEMPDHASLELAFLAFIAGQEMDGDSRIEAAFLQQHAARWLPAFGRGLAASGDAVYAPIGQLLASWLEEVCVQLHVPGFHPLRKVLKPGKRLHLPQLEQPATCTLCSFCVQACPTGALAIHENDHATELALEAARCIGCGKCMRACPEQVLSLSKEPALDLVTAGTWVPLRHSDRVVCKACGAPMVSQAELAYVAERLGSPAWLAYCPDCRLNIP